MEIDFTEELKAAKKGKAPLNKPFRLPSGSKKKFGVYVKNDKGNIVMVKFGDPNMEIRRDDPARRKAFRSRHSCDDNPGPKYKARYWSCRMWEAGKSVTEYTKGSCGKPGCASSEEKETESLLEIDIQAKSKGLWYNIQQKKKRMGKNYRPAQEGSKDRPSPEAIKKAQAEEYEWDGITEFNQEQLLRLDPSLAQVEEMEDIEDEYEDYKEDFYGMIVGSINSIYQHAKNVMDKVNDPMVKENLTEPFLQQMAILAEDYMITIHNYVMFNKENQESSASMMFKVGDKVKNVNAECKHYGSEGIVKEIRDLPDDMGYAVVYECTNDGASWKKGDMLGKTEVQLVKASYNEKYTIEADEEYKKMMVVEGQKFNEFLKQCIPSKKGDDKAKFKSCLEDYKRNK